MPHHKLIKKFSPTLLKNQKAKKFSTLCGPSKITKKKSFQKREKKSVERIFRLLFQYQSLNVYKRKLSSKIFVFIFMLDNHMFWFIYNKKKREFLKGETKLINFKVKEWKIMLVRWEKFGVHFWVGAFAIKNQLTKSIDVFSLVMGASVNQQMKITLSDMLVPVYLIGEAEKNYYCSWFWSTIGVARKKQ